MIGVGGRASLVAAVFLLAACSGSDEPVVSAEETLPATTTSEPTTVPAESITTEATTSSSTTEAATTSSTAPPELCPTVAQEPTDPTSTVSLDVDGDGLADTVSTDVRDGTLFVVVGYGAGGSAELGIFDADPGGNVRVLGGIDFLGDGSEEIAVVTGGGAYTTSIGFVRSRECELLRLAFEDSSPATFLFGSSVANFAGMLCGVATDSTPPFVEQYFFTLVDGEAEELQYEGGFSPYTLEGDFFVAGFGDGTVLTGDELSSIAMFDCAGLTP